jgi:hypothetical protein
MGKENACAHQPITAVTVSIIAQILCAPARAQNDSIVAQSKRFTGRNRRSVVSDDLLQQIV